MSVLFKLTYGLYMVSTNFDGKDSGCIINTVMQQTAVPETLSLTINKDNYTTKLIEQSNKCVINILDTDTSFDFFKTFGMQSSKDNDKFKNIELEIVDNIKTNKSHSVGYFELELTEKIDVGTHYIFIGKIVNSKLFDNVNEPLTYSYYHKNIKPQPKKVENDEEVWVCKICGYEYHGSLPDDFICPLCKHGKVDFERIK